MDTRLIRASNGHLNFNAWFKVKRSDLLHDFGGSESTKKGESTRQPMAASQAASDRCTVPLNSALYAGAKQVEWKISDRARASLLSTSPESLELGKSSHPPP